MQRIITYALLLLLPCVLLAQNSSQRNTMLNATNTEALNELAQRVQSQNIIDQQIVELYALTNNVPIKQVLPNGQIRLLVRVSFNNVPEYIITDNVSSAASIGTNKLHTGELGFTLDGDGFYIGEWDGGDVLPTHESMTGRVNLYDTDATSSHSTHVAGTMIGDGTGEIGAKGMAPKARVESWDFTTDEIEMIAEAAGTGESPNAPFLVSNHSYGTVCGWSTQRGLAPFWSGDLTISLVEDYKFGWYNGDAQIFDEIANNTPYYLIFKSAGNDRGDFADMGLLGLGGGLIFVPSDGTGATNGDGYDCISTYGNAKNIMTVGAVEDVAGGYSGVNSVVMSSFSGWGPTDDGRVKPDIVTNGVSLNSADHTADNAYGSKSGTSMATPSAAGSAILLQEHYSETHGGAMMLSSTLKGLIINTADEAGNIGPDYSFGWGLMNTAHAAQLISKDVLLDDHIIEGTIADGGTYTKEICVGGSEPLKVTLTWNDPAATPTPIDNDVLDNPTPKLVNDLDLRITDANGTIYLPWVLNKDAPTAPATKGDNILDNVEQIYVEGLPTGDYTLTITNKGLSTANQGFSLIMTGVNNANVAADAGVIGIDGIPNGILCQAGTSACPTIAVQNFTCNTLAGLTLNYRINGGATTSFDVNQSLSAGEVLNVYLGEIMLSNGAGQTFEAWTTLPAGITDGSPLNDALTNTFTLTQPGVSLGNLPLSVDFSDGTISTPLTIDNPDGADTWEPIEHTNCPAHGFSATVNNYNYNAEGQVDGLLTPFYDLSGVFEPTLTFDLAYAPLNANSFEALDIRVENACGGLPVTVWSRAGLGLSTDGGNGLGNGSYQPATGTTKWAPTCDDWATVTVDLSDFVGQIVKIGLYNINGYGNDLFVDNINVSTSTCPSVQPVVSQVGGVGGCSSFDLTSTTAPSGYTYQWFKDGNPVVGATAKDFTAPGGGDYTVAFVGPCKHPISAALTVQADVNAPSITTDCTTITPVVPMSNGCNVTIPDLTGSIAATDDCDTDIEITQNPAAGTEVASTHGMEHPITITATDDGGLNSSCQVSITTEYVAQTGDETLPTGCTTNGDPMTINLDTNCKWTVPDLGLDANMTVCGRTFTLVQTPAIGTLVDGAHDGNYTVDVAYKDQDYVFNSCTLNVITKDVTAPTIITDCTTLNQNINLTNNCELLVPNFTGLITATDACNTVTINQSPAAFSLEASGHNMTHNITITATDQAGLMSTCTIVLTGKDIAAPMITTDCTGLNQDITLDNNCEITIPNFVSSIATSDNCTDVTVTQNPMMGTKLSSGHDMTHDVIITATDNAGLTHTCTIVLTGKDVTTPSISTNCSSLDQDVNLNGNCEVIVPDLTNAVATTDNCTTTITQNPTANTAIASGNDMTHVVTITVMDDAGLSSTCNVTLTGKNANQPIYEPDCTSVGPEVDLSSTCTIIIPNISTITTGGTCGNTYTVSQNPAHGTEVNSIHDMEHVIRVTATDQNNVSSSCDITITAKDRTAPSITNVSGALDQEVNYTNTCQLMVPDLRGDIVSSEDCANPVIVTQMPTAGSSISSAHNMEHTVILTATNKAGLTDTYEVTLTGKDVKMPTITTTCSDLNQNLTLSGACEILIPNLVNSITATDNCDDNVGISQAPLAGSLVASAHNMTHDVTITATDDAGQMTTCTVTLTGKDVIAPSLNTDCSSLAQELDLNSSCEVTIPNLISNINASDNCDNSVLVEQTPVANTVLASSHEMTHVVMITATDNAGLTSTCEVTLTAKDVTAPTFTNCSSFDQDIILDNNCLFIMDDFLGANGVMATDNCDNSLTITQTPAAGSLVSLAHNAVFKVKMTTTDDAGLTSSCFINLTGKDIMPPTITNCGSANIDANLNESCQVVVPDLTDELEIRDNCDVFTVTQSPQAGTLLPSSHNMTHNVMISVTDAAGLTDNCTVTFTAKDVIAPTINYDCSLSNQIVDLDNNCLFFMPNFLGPITATDNCDPNPNISQFPPAGVLVVSAHDREHIVTISATDNAGQVGICQIILTGRDLTPPTAIAKNITVSMMNGSVTVEGELLDDDSVDNCNIATYSVSPDTFTEEGDYTVTFTVTDAAGLTDTDMAIITVQGNVIVPITLINFTAQAKAKQSVLNWTIPRESLVNNFIVEWSTNSNQWQEIGTVETKSGVLRYDFIHTKPTQGANYYRLKQVEDDGAIEYSYIVQTTFGGDIGTVTFFPNPTSDQVEIAMPEYFDAQLPFYINIYNVSGQLVQSTSLNAGERLSLESLPSGLYQVQLIQEAQKAMGRIVKMK